MSRAMGSENKRIERQRQMLEGSIGKLILKMSIPTMLSFLITSIYSLADTYFVSSLGTNATAAVSVNTSLDMIIMMGGSMLAVGAASYISRLLGAGNKDRADKVLSTAFFSALVFGALIMIFGKIFITPLVRLLGATDTCEQYSIDYASYILYAAPFMATSFVMNQTLRSEGNAFLSMLGMGIGGILNCILDPFFILKEVHIFGLTIGGLGMEVAGASIATAISKLVGFVILISPYLIRHTHLRLSIRKISYAKDIVKEVVTIGSSSLFRTGLSIVAGIILNNIAGDISDSMLAAIGVSTKVMMFPFGFLLGFGQGYQPIAGYAWGARDYRRVRRAYAFAAKTAVIGAAAMGVIMFIFANQLINLFTESDADMMRLGALCIRIQCVALPAHGWVMIVNMFCGAIGYAFGALMLALARQGTCFIPIVFPMAALFGEIGLCSVQGVADVISIFLAIVILKKVMKKVSNAEEALLAEKVTEALQG
ncbi:MAG: MATE family efflux transporter [Lachnospiraceae bacterium]|nr:MATE family efflux transporter [Lachnospiraceae bacterium]